MPAERPVSVAASRTVLTSLLSDMVTYKVKHFKSVCRMVDLFRVLVGGGAKFSTGFGSSIREDKDDMIASR